MIGMNLWFAPQISEHCPVNSPGRLIEKETWFSRPGTASAFTPRDGIVQECRTSAAVISIRTCVCIGTTVRLSTSNRRIPSYGNSFVGSMYESNWVSKKSEYSYLQYHWCPIVLIVMEGTFTSSSKYKRRKEGSAMKISVMAGKIVQMVSISCPSARNRFEKVLARRVVIIYATIVVIRMRIIIVWS